MSVKLSNIPNYISASTLNGLRRLMLRNNVRNRTRFVYQDIQYVNGKWYAFYNHDATLRDANAVQRE